ncbi:hypothetical protein [Glycocaulis sp.]|uniref:hypothetical protein n=1 Tax=Glycocaulis sp. TaxID=1969725 RepID=UPI003D2294F8
MLTFLIAAALGLTPFNHEAPESERLAFALDRANPVDERFYAVQSFIRITEEIDHSVMPALWELVRSGEVELHYPALLALTVRGDAGALPELVTLCTAPVTHTLARHRGSRFCSEQLVQWRYLGERSQELGYDIVPALIESYDRADIIGRQLILQIALETPDTRLVPLLTDALSPEYWHQNWLLGYYATQAIAGDVSLVSDDIAAALDAIETSHWLPLMRWRARLLRHFHREGSLERSADPEISSIAANLLATRPHLDAPLDPPVALQIMAGWPPFSVPAERIFGENTLCTDWRWLTGDDSEYLEFEYTGQNWQHGLVHNWVHVHGTNFGEWGGSLSVGSHRLTNRMHVADIFLDHADNIMVASGYDGLFMLGDGTIDRIVAGGEPYDHHLYRLERWITFPSMPMGTVLRDDNQLVVIGRSWALSVRNGEIEGYLPCAVSSAPMDEAD